MGPLCPSGGLVCASGSALPPCPMGASYLSAQPVDGARSARSSRRTFEQLRHATAEMCTGCPCQRKCLRLRRAVR
eukprot:2018044-Pyramimonas_sp.AAC.1